MFSLLYQHQVYFIRLLVLRLINIDYGFIYIVFSTYKQDINEHINNIQTIYKQETIYIQHTLNLKMQKNINNI